MVIFYTFIKETGIVTRNQTGNPAWSSFIEAKAIQILHTSRNLGSKEYTTISSLQKESSSSFAPKKWELQV